MNFEVAISVFVGATAAIGFWVVALGVLAIVIDHRNHKKTFGHAYAPFGHAHAYMPVVDELVEQMRADAHSQREHQ